FTAAFQQARGIQQLGSMEETDGRVGPKHVDVAEWRIFHARHRTSVVNQLTDVVAALPHSHEPYARDGAKRGRLSVQPEVDGRVTLEGSREPEQLRRHASGETATDIDVPSSTVTSIVDVHGAALAASSGPMCTRACTSAKRAWASGSGHSFETAMPTRNDSGIVISPGLRSGNGADACFRMSIWIVGESEISTSADAVPASMLACAPRV